MTKASDNVFPRLLVSEGGSTATPASGNVTVYAKADGLLYSKDDAGTETLVSGAAGGALSGVTLGLIPFWAGYHGTYDTLGQANRAVYVPVVVLESVTVTGILATFGASSGNIDVGLFSDSGGAPSSKLASSGSTAHPGTGRRVIAFASSYSASAGRYWLAVAQDNNTSTWSHPGASTGSSWQVGFEASAFPLPATATPSYSNSGTFYLNIMGVITGGFPTS